MSQDVIDEVKERFKAAQNWEDYTRRINLDDLKFGTADSDNGYQWPEGISNARADANQPMLTINKTRVHCLQIINDAKQNRVRCKVSATGDEATYEAAQILEGVIRHIEYQSNAEDAYDEAIKNTVFMGIGYWEVTTDYVDDRSFDQELFIRPIKDPLTVYLDPDITETDGSDAKWGLIYTDIPRWQFDREYPKMKGEIVRDPILELSDGMKADKHIRVVKYYRRNPKEDTLIALDDGQMVLASDLPRELVSALKKQGNKNRPVQRQEVEWFKIAGGEIVAKGTWPSKYIPIVRVPGEETFIEGKYDRKGHVRALKDAQRTYNYWASGAVEMVALQPKAPFVGAMEAFGGLETYWDAANTSPAAWLPYNAYNDEGKQLQAPQRQPPPVMPQAYMAGLAQAAEDMQLVTGQHEEQFGQQSNVEAGVAIANKQRKGDQATYGFVNALAMAIRYTGRILIDMIPKVYDTERVIQIMQEDGTQVAVRINPEHGEALTQQPEGEDVSAIFNPSIGKYAVEADVGPDFGTRRKEAFDAIIQMMGADPQLRLIAGDLLFKAADFPMADELAERLKNFVPPQAFGGPGPELQAAQQQIQQLQQLIQKLSEQLTNKNQEIDDGSAKHMLEALKLKIAQYGEETKRMDAEGRIDPEMTREIMRPVVMQLMAEMLGIPMQIRGQAMMEMAQPGQPQ